jgi:hypothetical protein
VPTFLLVTSFLVFVATAPLAAQFDYGQRAPADRFRQLEEVLPTPNRVRTASGAPGELYWQQTVDYEIEVELDDQTQELRGHETIRYQNDSPHALDYLWLQLDANIYRPDSDATLTRTTSDLDEVPFSVLEALLASNEFDGGVTVKNVVDRNGEPLEFTIVKTMMRVDLPGALAPGKEFLFSLEWQYHVNNSRSVRGRTGYEYFEDDGNYIYEIAQWFPRLAAYTDSTGWQHKQFLGSGEFTLEFGNYDVSITVPADHVVAATGELQNPGQVLSQAQRKRLSQARDSREPIFVITPEEARQNERTKATGKKTWRFVAERVRDFAFASSRKFIWDAQGYKVDGRPDPVMAMSYYPNEGEPLWSRYSTHAIVHTLDVYSRLTFPYPYPVAISVNGPVGGMEYPMICFNGPRPDKDGTYSSRTKYGLISVVIHEVGHNWFPMIVNSDERQWTWMDEGINSFLQFVAEQEWEPDYPSRRGDPKKIVPYMSRDRLSPVMTNSESVLALGPNAYAKPATALNILRETILGRELFDYSFKQYAQRWMFKRPMPADLFRSLEDASSIDLDWFWRGWFYGTDPVDLAVTGVRVLEMEAFDPDQNKERLRRQQQQVPESISSQRNRELRRRIDEFPQLRDFYNDFDEFDVTESDRAKFRRMMADLSPEERKLLATDKAMTLIDFKNVGGLVMPLILRLEYEDGSDELMRIPAEIWRRNSETVTKLFITDQKIKAVELDPFLETADIDVSNNRFPPSPQTESFKLFRPETSSNPMRDIDAKPGESTSPDEKEKNGQEKDSREETESEDKGNKEATAAQEKQQPE